METKQTTFWALTIAALFIGIVSLLIQDGCFLDGLLYTTVAKNLAEGHGSFWETSLSETILASYHHQPPLYFGLLGTFYRLFGTSFYVERLFSLCCFIITCIYLHKIYIFTILDERLKQVSWLPVFFWGTLPAISWAYTNMVSEILMTPLVLINVFYALKALKTGEKTANSLLFLCISGVFIWMATMTKGIQGAFGLIVPVVYWFVFRSMSFWRALAYNLFLLAVPTIIYALLLLSDDAVYKSFDGYFKARILTAFDSFNATTSNHFSLISDLAIELLPVAACSILVVYFVRKKLPVALFNLGQKHRKTSLFFLLIGLAGSIPLMITLQQRSFYLTTALPYFILLFCYTAAPSVLFLVENINLNSRGFQLFKGGVYALLLVSIMITLNNIGKVRRDNDLVYDMHLLEKTPISGTIVSVPGSYLFEYELQAYLARYNYISIDVYNKNRPYFLVKKEEQSKESLPNGYKRVDLPTRAIDIYQASE